MTAVLVSWPDASDATKDSVALSVISTSSFGRSSLGIGVTSAGRYNGTAGTAGSTLSMLSSRCFWAVLATSCQPASVMAVFYDSKDTASGVLQSRQTIFGES